MSDAAWLQVTRGDAPLLVSIPHTGLDLMDIEPQLVSPWLARKDADWWIEQLYDFVKDLGATVVRTNISRSVIDVNRDPSGASLYPGMATTELCPSTTFDGEPLYQSGAAPTAKEIARRRHAYFDPYHETLSNELARLRTRHPRIALYDCHSIRSIIPRLFDGERTAAPAPTRISSAPFRKCSLRADSPLSSMPASKVDGSRETSVAPIKASTPSRWSSPVAPICASRHPSRRIIGRRHTMPPMPTPRAVFSKKSFQ
jgi:N-formylglutamate amidohydrolase